MSLKHEEITREVIGAAFEVHRILGYGFLEKVYQRSMKVELALRGIESELEKSLTVCYKKENVGDYSADLFVAEKVIVELKVAREYNSQDEAQLLNELKATKTEVGVLINFGAEKVEFKRMIFTE